MNADGYKILCNKIPLKKHLSTKYVWQRQQILGLKKSQESLNQKRKNK